MIGFPINHPPISLEIRLEEIGRLHIHEKTLEKPLRRLVETIKSDGCVMDPVIVDRKTLVVLDGVHRVIALRRLGCRFIPVCLLDYDNPHVLVDCWYRTVNPKSGLGKIRRAIEGLGFTLKNSRMEVARSLVKKREVIAALSSRSRCYLVNGVRDSIKEVYDAIGEIELKLEAEGYSIGYETESDAESKVASGEVFAMLMVPTVSKEEVVEVASKGQVFISKTTRHTIPVRLFVLNVPLEWLCSKSSPEKINKKFVKYLSTAL